jgi:hypothetical protein
MRPAIYARLLIVPLLWVIVLFVIPFLIGFFWPSAAVWVESNAALAGPQPRDSNGHRL